MPNRSTSIGSLPIHCVASQWNRAPRACADPGQVGNGVERVDHAVGGLDRNEPGVGGPCGIERIGVNLAQRIGPEPGDADAAGLLDAPDRLGHGLVFDRRRDDVARRGVAGGQPEDCQVIGLGRRGGEDDLARAGAEQPCDRVATSLDGVAGGTAQDVAAGRVAELLAQQGQHRRQDGLVQGRRGVVVEIDDVAGVHRSASSSRTRRFGSPRILDRRKPASLAWDWICSAV